MKYCCDVCGQRYDEIKDAAECEAKGIGKQLPEGLLYGFPLHVALPYTITFAIAKSRSFYHSTIHWAWACRDTAIGDTLEHLCRGPQTWPGQAELNPRYKTDPNHPTFQRLVEHVRQQGIVPSYWDGEKIVLLEA